MTQGKSKDARKRDTLPSIPSSIKESEARGLTEMARIQNALELTRYSQLMDQDNKGPLTFIYCVGVGTKEDCGAEPGENGVVCECCWERLMGSIQRFDIAEALAKEYCIRYGLIPQWWEIIFALDS